MVKTLPLAKKALVHLPATKAWITQNPVPRNPAANSSTLLMTPNSEAKLGNLRRTLRQNANRQTQRRQHQVLPKRPLTVCGTRLWAFSGHFGGYSRLLFCNSNQRGSITLILDKKLSLAWQQLHPASPCCVLCAKRHRPDAWINARHGPSGDAAR